MTVVRHLTDEEIQLHLDGAPGAGRGSEIEAHLEGCPDCQATLLSFEALSEALSSLPAGEAPADFTASVMARIDEREQARESDRRVAVTVLGAVALALTIAVAAAGQAAWAPAFSAASSAGVALLRTVRIGADILSPVLSALRLEILVVTALLGIALTLALSRLAAPPRHGHAA